MSDAVTISAGLFSLISAMFTAYLAFLTFKLKYQSQEVAEHVQVIAQKQDDAAVIVERIEKHTNSLTEQLVQKTEDAGIARGGMEERARADARDAKKEG